MPIDREQLEILRSAADQLADAGAKVEDAHPDVDFGEQRDLFFQLIGAAIAPSSDADDRRVQRRFASRVARGPTSGGPGCGPSGRTGSVSTTRCSARCCRPRRSPMTRSGDFFSRTLTINGEEHPYMLSVGWTGLIGVVGLPAAVPPVGRTAAGLPVGVQVVAPYLRDREAVQLAGLLAEVSGGGYQPPPGF